MLQVSASHLYYCMKNDAIHGRRLKLVSDTSTLCRHIEALDNHKVNIFYFILFYLRLPHYMEFDRQSMTSGRRRISLNPSFGKQSKRGKKRLMIWPQSSSSTHWMDICGRFRKWSKKYCIAIPSSGKLQSNGLLLQTRYAFIFCCISI